LNETIFRFPQPAAGMSFDGERYVSGFLGSASWGDIQSEHYHRYLFALRFCEGKAVLDIASGEGYGSHCLGQVARSVIGVDVNAAAVDFATRTYRTDHVSFRCGSAQALPIDDGAVDVAVSFETVEHFTEHEAFAAELRRVLRPNGLLVISSPNRPVYSAGGHNQWHLRELDRAELLEFLSASFAHVRLLAQRSLVGSVIASDDAAEHGRVEGFMRCGDGAFRRTQGVPQPPYFVALASDGPLPEAPFSVLQNPALLLDVDAKRQQAADFATDACAQAMGFAKAFETAQAEAERIRQQAAEAHKLAEAELFAALGKAAGRPDEPPKTAEQAARLVEALRQELATACRRNLELAEEARALRQDRDRYASQFDAISQSTIWRATWPVRVIASRLLSGGGRRR
jgi:SAM-dependent methyltransferase